MVWTESAYYEYHGSPCQSCYKPQFLPETYSVLCTAIRLSGPKLVTATLLLRLIEQVSDGRLPGLDEVPPEIPLSEPKTQIARR